MSEMLDPADIVLQSTLGGPQIPPEDSALLKRRSVHGAAATFVAQALRFMLQFGSQVALARLLLPAEFGLVAMIGPVVAFITIFNELGLTQATVQRAQVSQQELSNLFWINVAVSLALALLMGAAAPLVAEFYHEPRLTAIAMWLASLLVVGGLSAQHLALMNRNMRFIPLAIIDVACTAFAVAVGIFAAWYGLGYRALVLMQAANALTIMVLAWAWSRWVPSLPRWERGILPLLRFGGHITGYNLINFAGSNLDNIMIGKLRGAAALGLYDRAFKLVAAPIWSISMPVERVAVSLLSRLQTTPERYRRAYLLLLQVLLLVTVPAVACVAATAGTLVPFLLGAGWAPAAPIVAWLAVATAFAPLSISASWLFVSQDRAAEQMGYAVLRAGLALLALGLGLPWGPVGVARSYAMFGLLMHGLPLWGATRSRVATARVPVGHGDVLRSCYPMAASFIVAFLAVHFLLQQLQQANLPTLLCLAASIGVAYAVCVATMVCLPGGLRLLRELWLLRGVLRPSMAAASR